MSKTVAIMSMSLDGYVADVNDGVAEVFDWYSNSGDVEIHTGGSDPMTFKVSAPSAEHFRGLTAELGAVLTGRRTFDVAQGWGGNPPCFDRPVTLVWWKRTWSCPEPACPVAVFTEQDEAVARPRGLLTTRAAWWAARQLRREHASVLGLARQLGTSWKTVWRSIKPLLEAMDADPTRFDGVETLGVDEHVWHHVSPLKRGPKELTGMVDLTRDEKGKTRARLLDLVPGRSGPVYRGWLQERGEAFTAGVKIATLDPFQGYKNAIDDELQDAVANAWGPAFVVTHHIPDGWPRPDSTVHFVTDGIDSAVAQAKAAAHGKSVGVHGADTIQQCLNAGLLDEIHVDLAAVLLGAGVRLFDHLPGGPAVLGNPTVIQGVGVSHLRYPVSKA